MGHTPLLDNSAKSRTTNSNKISQDILHLLSVNYPLSGFKHLGIFSKSFGEHLVQILLSSKRSGQMQIFLLEKVNDSTLHQIAKTFLYLHLASQSESNLLYKHLQFPSA